MDVDFESHGDVQRKLDRCIVEYKGALHSLRVTADEPDYYKVRLSKIPGGRAVTVSTQDPDFEARFLPLGYMNIENGVVWMTRNPTRRMVLGIGDHVVNKFNLDDRLVGLGAAPMVSQDYINVYEDKYPSFVDALKDLTTLPISGRAIARDFAIGWLDRPFTIRLYYRQTPVGLINWEANKPLDDQAVNIYNTPFKSFIAPRMRELRIPRA